MGGDARDGLAELQNTKRTSAQNKVASLSVVSVQKEMEKSTSNNSTSHFFLRYTHYVLLHTLATNDAMMPKVKRHHRLSQSKFLHSTNDS